MKKIIVDIASAGQEALAAALANPELEILGVTVSPDVENYDDLCNLTLNTVKAVKDVPVFKGAQRPLLYKDYVMGKKCPETATEYTFADRNAVNFMIDTANECDGLEIVCLGTLSNLALAILMNEEAMKKVKRVYVAGGALLGYQTPPPAAHHAILADPEAADTVFELGIPITMIPAHITDNLQQAAFDVLLGAECETWDAYLDIDTGIGFTRGQTVVDLVGHNPINGAVVSGVKQTVVTAIK